MPLEIERKFLVIGPLPLPRATKNILQGYLPNDAKVTIEDEFLVINAMPHSARAPRVKLRVAPWQAQDIRNGVINAVGARVLRIRIENNDTAVFCMKVDLAGTIARTEIELPVPFLDAMFLIQCCRHRVIRKVRREVLFSGKLWEVDVFESPLNGLMTAEIELASESEPFDMPPWVGVELTHNPAFSNRALSEALKPPKV